MNFASYLENNVERYVGSIDESYLSYRGQNANINYQIRRINELLANTNRGARATPSRHAAKKTRATHIRQPLNAALRSAHQISLPIREEAMAAAHIAQKHGNVMPADRLVKQLAANHGSRPIALWLVNWFKQFTAIRWEPVEFGKPFEACKPSQDRKKEYHLAEGQEVLGLPL